MNTGLFAIPHARDLFVCQDPDQDYGKVIDLDLVSGTRRIVAAGLRNMQGVALTAGGALYTVEHGLLGGDELNAIVDGANYGWPLESYGIAYSKEPLPGSLSFSRPTTAARRVSAASIAKSLRHGASLVIRRR